MNKMLEMGLQIFAQTVWKSRKEVVIQKMFTFTLHIIARIATRKKNKYQALKTTFTFLFFSSHVKRHLDDLTSPLNLSTRTNMI